MKTYGCLIWSCWKLSNLMNAGLKRTGTIADCLLLLCVVLHLVEGKVVNSQTFRQSDITKLWKKQAEVFASDQSVQELARSKTVSEIVCNSSLALRGTHIVDTFGVETIVTIVKSAATVPAKIEDESEILVVWTATEGHDGSKSQRKAMEAKSVDDDERFDNNNDAYHDDAESDDTEDADNSDESDKECEVHDSEDKIKERDEGNVSLMAGKTTNKLESSLLGNLEDTLLYYSMKEANVECFPTLEDATPIIEAFAILLSSQRLSASNFCSTTLKSPQPNSNLSTDNDATGGCSMTCVAVGRSIVGAPVEELSGLAVGSRDLTFVRLFLFCVDGPLLVSVRTQLSVGTSLAPWAQWIPPHSYLR